MPTPLPSRGSFWNEQTSPISEETIESSPEALAPPEILPPQVPPLWTPADLDGSGRIPAGSRILIRRLRVSGSSVFTAPEPMFVAANGCTTWAVEYCERERIETYWLLGSQSILVAVQEQNGHCYRRGVTICPDGTIAMHDWGFELVIGDPGSDTPEEAEAARDFFERWGQPPPPPPWTPPDLLLGEQGTSETIDGDFIVYRRFLLERVGAVRVVGGTATAEYREYIHTMKWHRVGSSRGAPVDGYPRDEPVPGQPPVTRHFQIPGCRGGWSRLSDGAPAGPGSA